MKSFIDLFTRETGAETQVVATTITAYQRSLYPEVEKKLKEQLPKITKDFSDMVLVELRKKVYGSQGVSKG